MVTELVTPNLDANTFELKGPWEQDRGPQQLAYDLWWHLGHDTMISSEWGTPNLDE
jgi:selenium-binding protein 1